MPLAVFQGIFLKYLCCLKEWDINGIFSLIGKLLH